MENFINLRTKRELSEFLEIPYRKLTYVLYYKETENLYTTFEIPKKSGGFRTINAPLDQLKEIQIKLTKSLNTHKLENDTKRNISTNISHGFEKDKSIFTNAKIHRNKKYVLNIDLESFFDYFHFGRVRGFFMKNNDFLLSEEVATTIAQLVCYKGKLPQGAPTSPVITNLICNILDMRILRVAKKFKLDYTRYADDLTFSTNNKNFLDVEKAFYKKIEEEILKFGFKINENKIKLQYKHSRQEVTGLVVNEKLNIKREFYRDTRAMAYNFYKYDSFLINGEEGTINQLEGRFSFINQVQKYNNIIDDIKHDIFSLNGMEKQYQKFLFYKYFFINERPLIVTEGKTDILYLKSALKNMYIEYPNLIEKNDDGSFIFKISFLKKSRRLAYFLHILLDGASALDNISKFFTDNENKIFPNYFKEFISMEKTPLNPVILIYDNEIRKKGKPIETFAKKSFNAEKFEEFKNNEYINYSGNLFLMITPLIKPIESDIEDLFDNETLSHVIDGRVFTKIDKYDITKNYGKDRFSKYVMENYKVLNFENFKPLLNNIDTVIKNDF